MQDNDPLNEPLTMCSTYLDYHGLEPWSIRIELERIHAPNFLLSCGSLKTSLHVLSTPVLLGESTI